LLESTGSAREWLYRPLYERHVAEVRAQLGDAAFAAAWAAGRTLPLEDAIAEALALAPLSPP
jgi:hypothetical protein